MRWLKQFIPLPKEQEALFQQIKPHVDAKRVKQLIQDNLISLAEVDPKVTITQTSKYVQIYPLTQVKKFEQEVEAYNTIIRKEAQELDFKSFAPNALNLSNYIAPHLHQLELIKKAVLLQLFSTERIHILLLGDPGTGKTDIIRSSCNLHPISAFGLGSGTSGVGLTVSVQGKKIQPGLLPEANKGIAGIDELNLIKKTDVASLYNAMEKGFVSYKKGSHDLTFDAQVRVLATANPVGDKFVGRKIQKEQIPFDMALLSRFHLVYFIRSPNLDAFTDISKQIVNNQQKRLVQDDIDFMQSYITYAQDIKVQIPEKVKSSIVEHATSIKEKEKKLLFDITPRMVHGIMRLAQASARLELRTKVEEKDVALAIELIESALKSQRQ